MKRLFLFRHRPRICRAAALDIHGLGRGSEIDRGREQGLYALREAFEWALDVAVGLARDFPEEVEAVERVRTFMRASRRGADTIGRCIASC